MGFKAWIQNILEKRAKQPLLPAVSGTMKEVNTKPKKASLVEKIAAGTYRIDMEKDFLKLYDRFEKCSNAYERLLDSMYIFSLGYSQEKNENIEELKREVIEDNINDDKKSTRYFATMIYKMNRNNYFWESFQLFIDVKNRQGKGENVFLTPEQQEQVKSVEQLIGIMDEMNRTQGTLLGMYYATYKKMPTTEKTAKDMKDIEDHMEKTSLLAEMYRYLASQHGIEESNDNKTLYRLICLTDKAKTVLDEWEYSLNYDAYKKAFGKYSKYLEYGGALPDLKIIFDRDKRSKISEDISVDEEGLKDELDLAYKLKEQGKIGPGYGVANIE